MVGMIRQYGKSSTKRSFSEDQRKFERWSLISKWLLQPLKSQVAGHRESFEGSWLRDTGGVDADIVDRGTR
jgi:hypothetical protein